MSGLRPQPTQPERSDWLENTMRDAGFQLDQLLKTVEKEAIDLALREHGGNVSKAAEMLGVNRTTLYGRIDRLEDRG